MRSTFLSAVFILFIFNSKNQTTDSWIAKSLNKPRVERENKLGESVEVTATMYYAVASQCDSDPLTTADGSKINPRSASDHKWIAMSRDLIERWGGDFAYGDKVLIEGAGHKDGIYEVHDTMNKRFTNKIDFLESEGTPLYKFENVRVTKIL